MTKFYLLFLFFLIVFSISCNKTQEKFTSYEQWELIQLDFEGSETAETAEENPFTDYRLNVTFRKEDKQITVPGFYAADGQAGKTSAEKGNVWRVNFSADETGDWQYEVSFRKGKNIAVSTNAEEGEPTAFDGQTGAFTISASTKTGKDLRKKGRILTAGRYLKHAGSGDVFLKIGANSPENFLAYEGFDGTYNIDSSLNFIKSYKPHYQDWDSKDDGHYWKAERGKGIIGAINYLAAKGMNVIYFLSMNIEGDGQDVFPYREHTDFTRFDCSKLDQWDIVFSHAEQRGMMLHFVTQETENELLLDDGNTGFHRELYYRELVARFGYHNGVMWNLGEENGPASFTPKGQTDQQRKDMVTWFDENDPFNNPLVIHTHSWEAARSPIIAPLLGFKGLDGLSFQQGEKHLIHQRILEWRQKSKAAGKEWMINMDEIGIYHTGAVPDSFDMMHDTLRKEVLWGSLLAGASGVEWYFGYKFPHADLNCEDWRTRDNLWEQSNHALKFFEQIEDLSQFENQNDLLVEGNGFCFAGSEGYIIYLKDGGTAKFNFGNYKAYWIKWYNPRTGGELQDGSVRKSYGNRVSTLGEPPSDPEKDWVVWVTRL